MFVKFLKKANGPLKAAASSAAASLWTFSRHASSGTLSNRAASASDITSAQSSHAAFAQGQPNNHVTSMPVDKFLLACGHNFIYGEDS